MRIEDRISTGMKGFDKAIDYLRLGDNVVWQVDSIEDYSTILLPYVQQALEDGRKIIYMRFGLHPALLEPDEHIRMYDLCAECGFEQFATKVNELIALEGRKAFYVFDCLTDLLEQWNSDLMIGNFFKVTCPFLYELDTIAYFAIIRNAHTFNTIAGIRETTQLLLDLYKVEERIYIHPLKVWQRYSPTMFFPHLIEGDEAKSITASSEAAALFSAIIRGEERLDRWNEIFNRAKDALAGGEEEKERAKIRLLAMIIGPDSRMMKLAEKYASLEDLLKIGSRIIGTGCIGGKSVGMLVARKILMVEGRERFKTVLEPHDSYYIGTDVFYTYIVQNGWWSLRTKQKTLEGYYEYASEFKEKLMKGKFPENIKEKFMQLLEYFGQSPIIVRSSSLLEDDFGNAFAGKYESVFCANQGTPEERYEAFSLAVRTVYASTMNEDALAYRMNRGLFERDEQMAILVQRVSGDYYGEDFFPHVAGVGNSSNLYVWDESVDMNAGMLRLVFGLGTRAVDRTVGDYARIVCLDKPTRLPPLDYEDQQKFSQRFVDVISLRENVHKTKKLEDIELKDLRTDYQLFSRPDFDTARRLRELGYRDRKTPYILDFQKLLAEHEFPKLLREMLSLLSTIYSYPVDIEFTANFDSEGQCKINLLQCRPLQTRGLGKTVAIPEHEDKNCLIKSKGNFMGGNIRLKLDYVIIVKTENYLALSEQNKYAVARQIGILNNNLKEDSVLLLGPGRWGTTTPSLGVPVHFTELCHMAAIGEVASEEAGFMPELSFGSHFFQDLVETGIFYAALFVGREGIDFHPELILERENVLGEFLPGAEKYAEVIHLAKTEGLELYSDIVSQCLLCGWF